MYQVIRRTALVLSVLFFVVSCGGTDTTAYKGAKYPPTTTVIPAFQPDQVPVNCKVFAQMLVWLPAQSTGKTIARAIEQEARAHGADMVLIGGSRQAEDDKGISFIYYGPRQQYKCRDKWCGWKYGYDVWADQGQWLSLGYGEWGNGDAVFDVPLVIQVAFLRCQE
jgi:coenzyme F420-reducing hydrogenase delta subunit